MNSVDNAIESKITSFDDTELIITQRRWLHIIDRHKELETMMETVRAAAAAPDEVFVDPRGVLHLVKSLKNEPTDFLVLIARRSGSETYLITAYLTSTRRKERRYQKFKRLLPY